jgi:hypothetical protein
MNAADTLLTAGFTDLLATAGDSVTFRAVTVSAVIDWTPFADKPSIDVPEFSTRASSRIEIPSASVSPAPKVGEVIQSAGPVYHRIQAVNFNGYAYACDCEVTP